MVNKKEKILSFMEEEDYKPLMFEELITVLDVPKEDIGVLQTLLDELVSEGRIVVTKKNRYILPEKLGFTIGTFIGNEKGFGFVEPDKKSLYDIFIPPDYTNSAIHNDRVMVKLTKNESLGKKPEGEVIKIIERKTDVIVGTFESNNSFGFVIPDDKRIYYDFFVPKNMFLGAKDGQKVTCEITKWPIGHRNPEGKIIEILGDTQDLKTDIKAIIRQFKLREKFPNSVYTQVKKIPNTVDEKALFKREDLRNLNIVTIDGEDAKDLDDAISVEKLDDGCYYLGVHIADVSHYVTEKSALDNEAFKRGTSVYFPDRVIPMLPKELSNGICSLNPDVDRLTLSVFMKINNTGKVVEHKIVESVINSKARMTYKDVTAILEKEDERLCEKYSHLLNEFRLMNELAAILKQKRTSRGSIDFNFPEAKILVDEDSNPIEVTKYELTISNRIIEEFMLVCNETIAEHMFWSGIPFVYRVHEEPNEEKIKAFSTLIYNLGYVLKGSGDVHPKELQKLLEEIKGKPEERIISTVMLRSLMKARYSDENSGHFGLAARYYCHFTSPIRRYPDLVIHRIIKEHIKYGIDSKREASLSRFVYDAAIQSSQQEVSAVEAEREVEDLLKTVIMKNKVGENFEGIISSVTHFGFFVELDNTVEGLVRVENIEDDFYIYDEEHYRLIGENTNKIYKIGDTVNVIIIKADVGRRKLEFMLE